MLPLYNDMPAPLPKPHCLKATAEPIPTDDDHVTIRIETYQHLATPTEWQKRQRNPAQMLQTTFETLNIETRTFGWRITEQQRTNQLTGYIRIKPNLATALAKKSGDNGIIFTHVGAPKDTVQWIPKQPGETDIDYCTRVTALAHKEDQGLAHRQGLGNSYLGIRGRAPSPKQTTRFTATGPPLHWGLCTRSIPQSTGIQQHHCHWSPKSTTQQQPVALHGGTTGHNGPQQPTPRHGHPTDLPNPERQRRQHLIHHHQCLATNPTQTSSKRHETEWVTPIGANKRQTTANPTPMDTSEPTAKRTTDEKETDNTTTDKRLKTNNGNKATAKTTPADIPTLTTGPQGEQIIDLGGRGDCGWRAAPAAIAFGNSKDSQYINSRLSGMSTTTRTKTIAWLKANTKEWQPFWATDPTANEATESGAVPTTADAWHEALINRPFKWVDHYATAAMARATGFDILVFEPDPATHAWTLRARQAAHTGIASQPIILLLKKDHFTTIHGKASDRYLDMTTPSGPCRFHGSGRCNEQPRSPATSSWCKPPPSHAPTTSSWCKPPDRPHQPTIHTNQLSTAASTTDHMPNTPPKRRCITGKTKPSSPQPTTNHTGGNYPVSDKPRQKLPWVLRNKALRNCRRPKPPQEEQSWTCPTCRMVITKDPKARRDQLSRKRRYHMQQAHPDLPNPDLRHRRTPVTPSHALPSEQHAWVCPICKVALPLLEERLNLDSIRAHIKENHPDETPKTISNKQQKATLPPWHNGLKQSAATRTNNYFSTLQAAVINKGHSPITLTKEVTDKYIHSKRFRCKNRHNGQATMCKTCWRFLSINTAPEMPTCPGKLPDTPRTGSLKWWRNEFRKHGDGSEIAAALGTTATAMDKYFQPIISSNPPSEQTTD